MRIRKRWPLTNPPLPPSSSSSSPPPSLTVTPATTPDLSSTRALHLLSSSQSGGRGGEGGGGGDGGCGLHRLADLSVVEARSRISPSRPSDLSNPSIPQRPDLQLTIVRGNNGWICAGNERDMKPDNKGDSDGCNYMHPTPSPPNHLEDSQVGVVGIAGGGGTGREHVEENSLALPTNRRNENNLGAPTSVGISASSSLSHQGGRWCEGERAFPLKKRRASYERKITDDTIKEKDKKMKTRVRTKVAKTWVDEDDEDEEEDDEEEAEKEERREGKLVNGNGNGAKKRGSVGVIMEGSRCSRVNGRGWRCCQQTLVGYSLCEHHLGKGRLRSMSSVRNRASTITNRPKNIKEEESGLMLLSSLSSSPTQRMKSLNQEESVEDEEEEDDDDDKPLMKTKKKRKKIGMVKARSISSLLGQTHHLTPAIVTLPPSSDPTGHNMVT
ncbi:uncharacterized protein LOC122064924 isoform X2 [Macadamia integrifolia]|uniref:uncharacterized protein LOC122064924 isoform X2 n=1 Tax=Macadamia integrifolia TaxID=60698 RepID=UPI001C4EB172|nr:uncharacterized protein LOC122064924 isoform X2 [Macadamia integrifolia]